MTVVARRIASVPQRTSSATWQAIIDLLAPDAGAARSTLTAITGPAAIAIAEEYTSSAPLVVVPASGPSSAPSRSAPPPTSRTDRTAPSTYGACSLTPTSIRSPNGGGGYGRPGPSPWRPRPRCSRSSSPPRPACAVQSAPRGWSSDGLSSPDWNGTPTSRPYGYKSSTTPNCSTCPGTRHSQAAAPPPTTSRLPHGISKTRAHTWTGTASTSATPHDPATYCSANVKAPYGAAATTAPMPSSS